MNTGRTEFACVPGDAADLSLEVAIIGGGLAGIYALYRARQQGLDCHLFEAGAEIGGTWHWNRYPGARCDIESFQYSYSFSDELQQEWHWSERFAAQPEILAYLRHVVDRFDLADGMTLNCRIEDARFMPEEDRWLLKAADGRIISARYCIMATGVLSVPRHLSFPGLDSFGGQILSTANWPDGPVDLAGRKVAVVGTGASGTQLLPHIVDDAAELIVFQRTPNFSVPTSNAMVDDAYERHWKAGYPEHRKTQFGTPGAVIFDVNPVTTDDASEAEREAEFERRWAHDGGLNFMRSFSDLSANERANGFAADFVRRKIAGIVKDPETARRLTPTGYPIDARRLATTDRDFYQLFNRPNVRLVSMLEEPIAAITATGIRTSGGDYPVDTIILATGFEPLTGALAAINPKGRDGRALRDIWADDPAAYLGVAISGFPNMFLVNGPGAPAALANLFSSSEFIVDWIVDCIMAMRARGWSRIEAVEAAQSSWMEDVQRLGEKTLMIKAPTSGYVYPNSRGERIFLCYSGGYPNYRQALLQVAGDGFEGFTLS